MVSLVSFNVGSVFVVFCSFLQISYGQLCSSPNGLGKCSSTVFTCVLQNGYPCYFKDNSSYGECSHEEFCCVNLPVPEDGSCAQRCGISGTTRQKQNAAESNIKLDKSYDWDLMLQAQERSSRIVNGSEAEKYEFCWQGGVFIVDTEQLQNNSANTTPIFIGGASLVAQDMALTAAHVLQPFITDANFIIFMAFGFRNISDVTNIMNASANWDEIPVFRVPNEMAFHSGYNDRTYENNIAIIRFNPISCDNANICPICLSPAPVNPFQPWKGTCYATGWGATSNTSVADTLQKLEMSIPYPQECLKSFYKLGLKNYDLPTTMLCADAVNQNGGTCDRDGGSPLVCQTKYGNWELSGIVGVGVNRCRQVGAPTLFTNVGYYFDWISSYSKGTYKEDMTTPPTSFWTSAAPLNDTTHDSQSDNTTSPTTTTLSTSTLAVSSTKPFRFMFNTPKVFVPKQTFFLDPQQKLAQAFFQERADKPTEVTTESTTTQATTTAEQTTTMKQSTTVRPVFSVVVNDADKKKGEAPKESSAIRLFFRPEMGMSRRKVTDVPNPASATQSASVASTTSTSSTTTAGTTSPIPSRITTTLATSAATALATSAVTSVTPTTTTSTTSKVSAASKQDVKESPSGNEIPTPLPLKPVTNGGYSKVVVFIRPEENNSILRLLRRRYKDSQLYTEAPTEAPVTKATSKTTAGVTLNTTAAPVTNATVISVTNATSATTRSTISTVPTTSVTPVAASPTRKVITFAPKETVTPATVAPLHNITLTVPVNVTVGKLNWNVTRPRDASIMF